jgi:CelD/BcsL family acetyltransferase involved in cellulose biosynthesis
VEPSFKLELFSGSPANHEWMISQWNQILCANPSARLFESPLWVLNYWEFRCRGRGEIVFLLGKKYDGTVVGIFPVVKRSSRLLPLFSTWECAHSTGEYESNWICHPDYAGRFATAVLDYLHRKRHLWYQVRMATVWDGSSALTALRSECERKGFSVFVLPGREIPFISLAGAASIEALVDGKYRREMKRRQNRLEKMNPLSFEIHTEREGLDAALDEFFHAEASGWKGHGGSAIRNDLSAERFWRNLSHCAAERKQLRLHLLRSGGEVIAGQLGIVFGRTYYCLKIGYDEKYRSFGPGALMTREAIQHCIEDPQVAFYDFAGAAMPYMSNWTSLAYRTWTIQIGSSHAALGGLFDLVHYGRRRLRPLWRAFKWKGDIAPERA